MRRFLLAVGLLAALAGPSLAHPSLTTAPSAMRKAANPHSRVVQAVPANAEVDIQSCGAEWCYGSWRGLHGFLPAFVVARDGAAPPFAAPPPPVVVTAPVLVAPPVYHWGGPYVGLGWGWGRW